MLHRIINWIANPFKKKEADTFSISEPAPLSEEVKNKIKADLIEAVKEFKEKKSVNLDELPLSRVSVEAKEKITEIVKEDIGIVTYPVTEEVVVSETPKTKKKRYYKKKKKANQEQPKETASIKPTKNKGSKK
jgi:hypothetical protein